MIDGLKWFGKEVYPDRPHAGPFLAVIEDYDTYNPKAATALCYEIVRYAGGGEWSFTSGRPEEGDGRRLVRWCRLPRLEGAPLEIPPAARGRRS